MSFAQSCRVGVTLVAPEGVGQEQMTALQHACLRQLQEQGILVNTELTPGNINQIAHELNKWFQNYDGRTGLPVELIGLDAEFYGELDCKGRLVARIDVISGVGWLY